MMQSSRAQHQLTQAAPDILIGLKKAIHNNNIQQFEFYIAQASSMFNVNARPDIAYVKIISMSLHETMRYGYLDGFKFLLPYFYKLSPQFKETFNFLFELRHTEATIRLPLLKWLLTEDGKDQKQDKFDDRHIKAALGELSLEEQDVSHPNQPLDNRGLPPWVYSLLSGFDYAPDNTKLNNLTAEITFEGYINNQLNMPVYILFDSSESMRSLIKMLSYKKKIPISLNQKMDYLSDDSKSTFFERRIKQHDWDAALFLIEYCKNEPIQNVLLDSDRKISLAWQLALNATEYNNAKSSRTNKTPNKPLQLLEAWILNDSNLRINLHERPSYHQDNKNYSFGMLLYHLDQQRLLSLLINRHRAYITTSISQQTGQMIEIKEVDPSDDAAILTYILDKEANEKTISNSPSFQSIMSLPDPKQTQPLEKDPDSPEKSLKTPAKVRKQKVNRSNFLPEPSQKNLKDTRPAKEQIISALEEIFSVSQSQEVENNSKKSLWEQNGNQEHISMKLVENENDANRGAIQFFGNPSSLRSLKNYVMPYLENYPITGKMLNTTANNMEQTLVYQLDGKMNALASLCKNKKLHDELILKRTPPSETQSFILDTEKLKKAVRLSVSEQKNWQLALHTMLCSMKEIIITWDESIHMTGAFIVQFPSDLRLTARVGRKNDIDKLKHDFQYYQATHEFITIIESRINRSPATIAQLDERDNLKMTVFVTQHHAPIHESNKIQNDIANDFKKQTHTQLIQTKPDHRPTKQNKQQARKNKKEEDKKNEDNDKKQTINESELLQLIKQLFKQLTTCTHRETPSFDFLNIDTFDDKKNRYKITYLYRGTKLIGRWDSFEFFKAIANILSSVNANIMVVNPTFKHKKDEIEITFKSTPEKIQSLLAINHPTIDIDQPQNLSDSQSLVSLFALASNKTMESIEEKSINNKDEINNDYIELTLPYTRIKNLLYHLEKLEILSTLPLTLSDEIEKESKMPVYFLAYLLHLQRNFHILSEDKTKGELFYNLRNIIRHFYPKLYWDTLHQYVQPLLNELSMQSQESIKQTPSFLFFNEGYVTIKIKLTIINELEEQLKPLLIMVHKSRDLFENKKLIKDKNKLFSSYKILLNEIVDSKINDEWRRDAALILCTFLQETQKQNRGNPIYDVNFNDIYVALGHFGLDKEYDSFANDLYSLIENYLSLSEKESETVRLRQF